MRVKIRLPHNVASKSKIESRYITLSENEYRLMNFIGLCMYIINKNSSNKEVYHAKD